LAHGVEDKRLGAYEAQKKQGSFLLRDDPFLLITKPVETQIPNSTAGFDSHRISGGCVSSSFVVV